MRAYLRAVRFYHRALISGRLDGPIGDEVIDILIEATNLKDRQLYRDVIVNWCNPDGFVPIASLRKELIVVNFRCERSAAELHHGVPYDVCVLRDKKRRAVA